MSYITRDFRCTACYDKFDKMIKRADDNGTTRCPSCGALANKVLSAPMVFKAAFQDGVDRGDGYRLHKEASKMETKMMDLPPDKRAEAKKEIHKIKKAAAGKKSK